jgi:hypothetical protein
MNDLIVLKKLYLTCNYLLLAHINLNCGLNKKVTNIKSSMFTVIVYTTRNVNVYT